jgi:uncharacterized protein YbjT (DUF2867 family)
MSEKKIITVFGATGAQGGGLVRAILNDPGSEFAVRAVTRDPGSDKAKALADLGAEVVAGDIDDSSSIAKALQGSYGAFFVTNFWEHFSPEKEYNQVKNMAMAAKEAGIAHAVWSTLEDTRKWIPLDDDRMPTLQEKYKVPHFDAKGAANQHFVDHNVPTTFFHTSFYWDNMIYFGMGPKPGPDGKLGITFPMGDTKLSGIAAEDIGKCAYGIFKKGDALIGKNVGVAGEHITCADMAVALSKALGRGVAYNDVPPEVYRSFGFPGADDLGNMFQFYKEFGDDFMDLRDTGFAKELNPALKSFDDWVAANKDRIPLD